MSGFSEYVLRICVGGICCSVATTLVGTGAKREIARFACTCVMLLLCFSGIKEIQNSDLELLKPSLQGVVEEAVQDQLKVQQAETDAALERYIQDQALAMDCNCSVKVRSVLREQAYQIQMITVRTEGGAANQTLQTWLVVTFKIKETQIRWEENR